MCETKLQMGLQVGSEAHSRLLRALWSDTAFLASLGVMDYSLLVGMNQSGSTLVVGIIDFIRQVCALLQLNVPGLRTAEIMTTQMQPVLLC